MQHPNAIDTSAGRHLVRYLRICLMLIAMLVGINVQAADRETELFNKGYEYLFSFKPEQAAQTFRAFLKEFPDSTARDAALFWLGKTLVSLRSYDEAVVTFNTIREEFPDSPFVSFIDSELDAIHRERAQLSAPGGVGTGDRKVTDAASQPSPGNTQDLGILLAQEREKNLAYQRRLKEIERHEADLTRMHEEAINRLQSMGTLERDLKDARDQKLLLQAEVDRLRAEMGRSEQERGQLKQQLQEASSDHALQGSPQLKISELEQKLWQAETELSQAREVQDKLRREAARNQQNAESLRAEVARLGSVEQELKKARNLAADRSPRDADAAGEILRYRAGLEAAQQENSALAQRISDMERQAEQRLKDMQILNSYLTKLMFQKKPVPVQPGPVAEASDIKDLRNDLAKEKKRNADLKDRLEQAQKLSAEAAEEKNALASQLAKEKEHSRELLQQKEAEERRAGALERKIMSSSSQRPAEPVPSKDQVRSSAGQVVRVHGTEYSYAMVIDLMATAETAIRKLQISDIVWRTGSPLDDFITEETLFQEALRQGIAIDEKRFRSLSDSFGLSGQESAYLRRFMTIAGLINASPRGNTGERIIDLLSVDYRRGDASAKTVLATELQKMARSGIPFEEIQRTYPDAVKFIRLSPEAFAANYPEKSQILRKLNFSSEETVVMWSESGYVIIRPGYLRRVFDPFAPPAASDGEREGLRVFARDLAKRLRDGN